MAGRAGVPAERVREVPARHALPDARRRRWQRFDEEGHPRSRVYGSGKVADAFNVANKVYKDPQTVDELHRPSLSKEALAK